MQVGDADGNGDGLYRESGLSDQVLRALNAALTKIANGTCEKWWKNKKSPGLLASKYRSHEERQ